MSCDYPLRSFCLSFHPLRFISRFLSRCFPLHKRKIDLQRALNHFDSTVIPSFYSSYSIPLAIPRKLSLVPPGLTRRVRSNQIRPNPKKVSLSKTCLSRFEMSMEFNKKNLRITFSKRSLITSRAFTLFVPFDKFGSGALVPNSKLRILNRRFNFIVLPFG